VLSFLLEFFFLNRQMLSWWFLKHTQEQISLIVL
jgi:hypothetical protein